MKVERRHRIAAVAAVVVLLCAAAALLLAGRWGPGGDTPARDLRIRLADVPPGVPKMFEWNGAPFALVRTTDAMLADLQAHTEHTWNRRGIPADKPPLFVYSLVSPVFGCVIQYAPQGAPRYAPQRQWQGGYYDPCQFAEWDFAGRAVRQYPDQEPTMRVPDLDVPSYDIEGGTLRLHLGKTS
jgi:ubiquinol-cytochrome c reductase iron-sulfur subunit